MLHRQPKQRIEVVPGLLIKNSTKREEGRKQKRMMRRNPEQWRVIDALKEFLVARELGSHL